MKVSETIFVCIFKKIKSVQNMQAVKYFIKINKKPCNTYFTVDGIINYILKKIQLNTMYSC